MLGITIKLFGEFSIQHAEEATDKLHVNRLQSLLAYLLIHRHTPQPRQQIAFQLWPETTEKQALTNLRNLLFQLRKAFPPIEEYLQLERKTLQWRLDAPYQLDVAEFETLLQSAANSNNGERQELLHRAVEIYHGDLAPSLYDEWAILERERFRGSYMDALQELSALLEAQRQYDKALTAAEELLQVDPLRESSYRLLMRLHAFNDDQSSALRVYEECEIVLYQELAVEPGPKTLALKESLLKTTTPVETALSPPQQPVNPALSVQEKRGEINTLVGRHHEWGLLQEAWRLTEAGHTHCVVLRGEAGIGKTRLAEEVVTWVQQQGHSTTIGHCYLAQQSLPYGPIIKWLRSSTLQSALTDIDESWLVEASRLLPELAQGQPILETVSPVQESWQRRHLFDALIQIVNSVQAPLLFVLDDMQWSDIESLEWLLTLLRENQLEMSNGQPSTPVLLLCTLRTEETGTANFLESWTTDLNRKGLLTSIKVGPLSSAETIALGSAVAESPLSEEMGSNLFGQTEGHPLYIVESIRANQIYDSPRDLERPAARLNGYDPSTTAMMESVIKARIDQLSETTRAVITFAAVIGREFDYEILVEANLTEEEALVDALDEALERGIIREQGTESYDFSHGKLRQAVYDELSNARRRLYHKKVAGALEEISASQIDSVTGQLALHNELGGNPDKAIGYYLHAAKAARDIYANEEALQYYQHLLSSKLASKLSFEIRGEILATAGQIWYDVGQWQDATSHYTELITLAESDRALRYQAMANLGLGKVLWRQGINEDSLAHVQNAEKLYRACDDLQGAADALDTLGDIHWHLNNQTAAQLAIELQQQIGDELNSEAIRCRTKYSLGRILWLQGDPARGLELCQEAFLLADQHGLLSNKAKIAHTMGGIHGSMGNHEGMWTWDMEALRYAEQMGNQALMSSCVQNLLIVCGEFGDFQALRHCALYVLANSIKIRDLTTSGLLLSNFGHGCLFLSELTLAQALLDRAQKIFIHLNSPQYLLSTMDSLSILYLETKQYEQVEALSREYPQLLSEADQSGVAPLSYRLTREVMLAESKLAEGANPEDALAGLETLLSEEKANSAQSNSAQSNSTQPNSAQNDEDIAGLHYHLWLLAPDREEHRTAAATLYHALNERRPRFQFRNRYYELTGDRLQEPSSLSLPNVLTKHEYDLEKLLTQIDQWLGDVIERSV